MVAYGFEKYSIPERIVGDPEKITQKGNEKIKDLEEKHKELMRQVDQIIKEHGAEILGYAEQLHVEENYFKILNMTRKTQKTTTLWGWITQRGIRKFKNAVDKSTDNNAIVEFSKPVFEESEFPTKTSVPKIIKIFDSLVSSYGIPGYKEFNPAIIFTIFYPIIFGIMFADVGHGLLFTLLGVYGLVIRNKRLDSGSFKDELLNYFKGGAILIIFSGICSMFFGVLFGSYFGLNHSHYDILKPIWFSPESSEPPAYNPHASTVILMLELSLVIGMIHMTIGYVLRLLTNLKHKDYKEAIFVTLMAMWFHWGLFILVFAFGTNFMTWFNFRLEGTFDLAIISFNGEAIPFFHLSSALIFFLIGFALPLLIMTGYLLTHGLDGMAELLELLLSTLSNTVSYSRIFAMNAVHGALSQIFLLTTFTGEGEPLGAINFIGLVIGALVILVLEGLFSFIQTLRLQWVEFFSKMGYHGTGIKFRPIAMARKYSIAT